MTYDPEALHPSAENLAAFAEGRLDAKRRAAVIEHLAECEECMRDVSAAMVAMREEEEVPRDAAARPHKMPWLIAAAAVAASVVAVPLVRQLQRDPIERLVALAPRDARIVEPRLSGGFAWAAYRGPARDGTGGPDPQKLKLGGAAGELIDRGRNDGSAEAQHAAGVAMVLMEKPESALAPLEEAAKNTEDAKVWSDLAAARYAAAVELGRASLLGRALAANDEALRRDASMPEAWFNRALILERLGVTAEARRAWERYLELDPSSPWAVEARARLRQLPAAGAAFDRERSRLEEAAARNDAGVVREIVDAHREHARAYAEAEYLGRWGEAVLRRDARAAERWLTVARAVAEALVQSSGESLLADSVRAIDEDVHAAARAHADYRAGRIAYSRNDTAVAEGHLRRAAERFAASRHPMELVARYYAASVRLARNDVSGARGELERLRAEADARPGWIASRARVRWELARTRMIDDDWEGAAPLLAEGAELFRRAGERPSEAAVEAMRATALASLGRADEAWSARTRAFAALGREGDLDRLAAGLRSAARTELRDGRRDAALALLGLQHALQHFGASPILGIEALVHKALIESASGRDADARRSVREAEALAIAVGDPALRARQEADIAVAAAASIMRDDPVAATRSLTRAIDFYRAHALPFALPEPLLLRARCAIGAGNRHAAARDLAEGIAIVERHQSGFGVLDAEHALYEEALLLQLAAGEAAAAFAYAERARGGDVSVAELQRRLAGSGAAVLLVADLPDELVTFAVAEDRFAVARRAKGGPLYAGIVQPVEAIVSRARALVIVADDALESVSFAALHDGERHLVERLPIALALRASALRHDAGRHGARSVAVIALPSGSARALPDAESEAADVAAAYTHASAVPPTLSALRGALADVLHISGHTERQHGAGEQALVFAGAERVSWRSVPAVRARTVVLAACETLRSPGSAHTRAPSLGRAFADAGAHDVIGTLTPIADRDARMLFRDVHHHLAAGANAPAAVREAQLAAIARGDSDAWRSLAVLTTRIPDH